MSHLLRLLLPVALLTACAPKDEGDLTDDTLDGSVGDGGDGGADGADGGDGADGISDGADGTEPVDLDGDGFSEADGDCDDGDADVNPRAPEVCDGVDNDCDGDTDDEDDSVDRSTGLSWYVDGDGDGYGAGDPEQTCALPSGASETAGDCDDSDADISPAAQEVCDGGVDNDCDGLSDGDDDSVDLSTGVVWYTDGDGDGYGAGEPAQSCAVPSGGSLLDGDCDDSDGDSNPDTLWYVHSDGDGFGDAASSAASCTQPSGTVRDDTDCDDADAANYPGNAEVCDDSDNDCDGDVDAADASIDPGLLTTSYADTDTDGYGDETVSATLCDVPSGYTTTGGDCDDSDGDLNPDTVWYGDGDSDGYGDASSTTTQCLQPSGSVLDATDCDDGDSAVNPAATEVCGNDVDDDCDGTPNTCEIDGAVAFVDADATWTHADTDSFWGYDALVGDFNADGVDDVLTAAYDAEPLSDGDETGQVYIHWGPVTGDLTLPTDADLTLNGGDAGDNAGIVNRVGDLDGDGWPDLVVGAPDADDNTTNAGSIYVLYGPMTGLSTTTDLFADADQTWWGEGPADRLGTDLSASGDVNGDGYADLLMGADGEDSGGSAAGAVYLVLGRAAPWTGAAEIVDDAETIFTGVAAGDYLGDNRLIADAVDLDGDGLDDIVLGSVQNDDLDTGAGSAWVVYGDSAGFSASVSMTAADAQLTGATRSDFLGEGIETVGDLDGDGYPELAVGADGWDGSAGNATGVVYVIAGGASRLSGTATAASVATATIEGEGASDGIGEGAAGGDLDADGFGDLLLGNDGDDTAAVSSGFVAVFYGPVSGALDTADADARLLGPATNSAYMGRQVRSGDLNDDGYDDVLGIAYGVEQMGVYWGGAF